MHIYISNTQICFFLFFDFRLYPNEVNFDLINNQLFDNIKPRKTKVQISYECVKVCVLQKKNLSRVVCLIKFDQIQDSASSLRIKRPIAALG